MAEAMLLFFALLFERLRRILRGGVRSVPSSPVEVIDVAERLYPAVLKFREAAHRQQVVEMRKHMRRHHGVDVRPAPVRPYPLEAVRHAVSRAARLEPERPTDTSGLDDKSRGQVGRRRRRPQPSAEEFVEDLTSTLERHVQNAAREAVMDTADLGEVVELDSRRRKRAKAEAAEEIPELPREESLEDFDEGVPTEEDYHRDVERRRRESEKETKREVRSGVRGPVLGWARVLAGETNCAFCAMLASRGPVYKSNVTAGFEAHDNCDCQVVLVVKGEDWPGREQFLELQKLWEDARDRPNDWERSQMEHDRLASPAARFRSRFRALSLNGESFKPVGVREAERLISVREARKSVGAG